MKSKAQTIRAILPPRPMRQQRGTVMLLTVIVLVVMLGMLALAIDLGFLLSARSQLQNGVDAAAAAGAVNLRATIEQSLNPAPERDRLVRDAAKRFASFNKVRLRAEQDLNDPINTIQLTDAQINIEGVAGLAEAQQVIVKHELQVPLFFAGLFGLETATVTAGAVASTLPVDGGTGGLNSCWRPLLLPDTFFDGANQVHWVGDPTRGGNAKPNQPGDYYRSRFAAGTRNTFPFLDARGTPGEWVTGLRDAQLLNDVIAGKTVMGTSVSFRKQHYLLANLSSIPRTTFTALSTELQARLGFCGRIRVGDEVSIYGLNDPLYATVGLALTELILNTQPGADEAEKNQFRYIKNRDYPANTHPRIIPVMFFNPFELLDETKLVTGYRLKITNIGLLYLEDINVDGDNLRGFFVRESFAEGTQVERANLPGDSPPSFQQSWLPAAARVLR